LIEIDTPNYCCIIAYLNRSTIKRWNGNG